MEFIKCQHQKQFLYLIHVLDIMIRHLISAQKNAAYQKNVKKQHRVRNLNRLEKYINIRKVKLKN